MQHFFQLDGKKVGKLTQSEKTTFEVKCKPGHHKVYVQRNGLFGDKNTNKILHKLHYQIFMKLQEETDQLLLPK